MLSASAQVIAQAIVFQLFKASDQWEGWREIEEAGESQGCTWLPTQKTLLPPV